MGSHGVVDHGGGGGGLTVGCRRWWSGLGGGGGDQVLRGDGPAHRRLDCRYKAHRQRLIN